MALRLVVRARLQAAGRRARRATVSQPTVRLLFRRLGPTLCRMPSDDVPSTVTPTLTRHPSLAVPGISSSARIRAGDLLFLSGQTAALPVAEAFRDELESAFSALDEALGQAGASWENLARITLYVVDLPSRSLDDIREVRDAWVVADCLPASSFVGVAALALPGLRVEIEAVAVV